MRRALLLVLLLLLPRAADAANAITPGVVTLAATLQSISVTAPFTGDDNGSATIAVQYRVTGSGTWRDGYAPYIDRRATIGGVANPFVSQARGAIVGLVKNTSYDVQVTWTDADGVTGGQPALVVVTTMTDLPPTGGGTTRNIIDNTTMTTALGAANPGDTLTWAAGSYDAFTLSRSGTAGAWIVLDGQGVATISGVGVNQNIALNANYVILKNFILSASDFNALVTSGSSHDQIISGNTVQGFSRLCADGPGTTHLEDSGILLGGGNSNVLVLANSITGSTNLIGCLQVPSYEGPGQGIAFTDCTSCVIAGNTIVGNGARDAIDSDNSADALANVDIANNIVSGYMDDGIEFKGQNVNVRAWGNVITQDGNGSVGGNTCMSNETTLGTNNYGPSYYFRNTCKIIRTVGGCAYKGPSGPLFYFHNSLDGAVASSGHWSFGCGASSVSTGPYVIYNNATKVSASMSEKAPAATTLFDYNCGTAGGTYAFQWDNATDYATFAAFRAGTGQETHGINADPVFSDTALHLAPSSPAINAGVVLKNFNSLDSAWPYSGSAPDIGAYEFMSGPIQLQGSASMGGRVTIQ